MSYLKMLEKFIEKNTRKEKITSIQKTTDDHDAEDIHDNNSRQTEQVTVMNTQGNNSSDGTSNLLTPPGRGEDFGRDIDKGIKDSSSVVIPAADTESIQQAPYEPDEAAPLTREHDSRSGDRVATGVTPKGSEEANGISSTAEARIIRNPIVTVNYGDGVLKVATKVDLRSILKWWLPRDAMVAKDGVIFVAFYYLPALLKELKKQFNDEEVRVNRGIPYIEEMEKLLGLEDTVDVEAELSEALRDPIMKRWLSRKTEHDRIRISNKIRRELQQDRWLNSVWERAGVEYLKPDDSRRRVKTDGE